VIATVAKWGNSLALRLPKRLADGANLYEGAAVEISVDHGTLVIRSARPRYTLDQLLGAKTRVRRRRETEWGAPIGKEVW